MYTRYHIIDFAYNLCLKAGLMPYLYFHFIFGWFWVLVLFHGGLSLSRSLHSYRPRYWPYLFIFLYVYSLQGIKENRILSSPGLLFVITPILVLD